MKNQPLSQPTTAVEPASITAGPAPNLSPSLEDLLRAVGQGLDVDRLLFARWLWLTRRLSDGRPDETGRR